MGLALLGPVVFGLLAGHPVRAAGELDAVEAAINAERAAQNLPPLPMDGRLRNAAGGHALDMAARDVCSHTGGDGSTPSQRMQRAGYPVPYGEIVACGYSTVPGVVAAWMNSPGHRAIILCQSCTQMGAGYATSGGVYRHYWVVNFGSAVVGSATATRSPTPTPSSTVSAPVSASATMSPSATVPATSTSTPTQTATPTAMPIATSPASATSTSTATQTPTATPSRTSTATASRTAASTTTASSTSTASRTAKSTISPTGSPSASATSPSAPTSTRTPSATSRSSETPELSATPDATATAIATATARPIPSLTPPARVRPPDSTRLYVPLVLRRR